MDLGLRMQQHINETRISVVTATYNAVNFIENCILSVCEQTYNNLEFIVIDGNSTDGTKEILQRFTSNIDYFISEPDNGIYDAWNKALHQVTGDWVIFLGADDSFASKDSLAIAADHLKHVDSSCRVAYAPVRRLHMNGTHGQIVGEPWEQAKDRLWKWSPIPHQGTFHHKTLFEIHGGFDATFKIAGDYELLLRELKNHDAFFLHIAPIVLMREGGVSTNEINGQIILNEVRFAQEKNGHFKPSFFWTVKNFSAISRKMLMHVFGESTGLSLIEAYRKLTGDRRY